MLRTGRIRNVDENNELCTSKDRSLRDSFIDAKCFDICQDLLRGITDGLVIYKVPFLMKLSLHKNTCNCENTERDMRKIAEKERELISER